MAASAERIAALRARPAVTLNEAVELSGISRSTLYHHITDGLVRATKCGGKVMIPVDEFEAWLRGDAS